MKKSLSVLFAVIVMAGLVVACGGIGKKSEENKAPKERIIGQWEIIEASGAMSELNIGVIYTFTEDGTFKMKSGFESVGKITFLDDNGFKVFYESIDAEFVYAYKFEGENLIIEIDGSDQKFTLKKI